jgi:protein-S-isoprenylcysteine O-methyltransferase Ste14
MFTISAILTLLVIIEMIKLNKNKTMNIQKLKSQFKENHKQILIVAAVVVAMFLAVMAPEQFDPKKRFWQSFWPILGYTCLAAVVIGWVFEWNSQKTNKNP